MVSLHSIISVVQLTTKKTLGGSSDVYSLARHISNVNESIVERGEDVSNAEDVFALLDLHQTP
jgi:hypothetical protein